MSINKKNLLIETFSILKDSWESKDDAIKKIILKMASIDLSTSISMWLYILQNNPHSVQWSGNAYSAIELMIYQLSDVAGEEKLSQVIFGNEELSSIIYGENAYVSDRATDLLLYLIKNNDRKRLTKMLDLVKSNTNTSEFTVGTVIAKVIEGYEENCSRLSNTWVKFFVDYANDLSNPTDKAEATVALLEYL